MEIGTLFARYMTLMVMEPYGLCHYVELALSLCLISLIPAQKLGENIWNTEIAAFKVIFSFPLISMHHVFFTLLIIMQFSPVKNNVILPV